MAMDKLPELGRLSEPEKDALITALWAEVQLLKARLAALEAKPHEPRKDAHNSSVRPRRPQAEPFARSSHRDSSRGQCRTRWRG